MVAEAEAARSKAMGEKGGPNAAVAAISITVHQCMTLRAHATHIHAVSII
jgi:hypothetical protein